jgi:hypothetical protein
MPGLFFKTRAFPSRWKVANLSAIPKKSDKCNPAKYRPIVKFSVLDKVMEIIVVRKFVTYLEKENRKLINIYHMVTDQFSWRWPHDLYDSKTKLHSSSSWWNTYGCFRSKTLDSVGHSVLTTNCRAHGPGRYFSNWIENFFFLSQ